ncbi:hypothetical protein JCM6882_002939 [Rhodosporidiobolus microsporus]
MEPPRPAPHPAQPSSHPTAAHPAPPPPPPPAPPQLTAPDAHSSSDLSDLPTSSSDAPSAPASRPSSRIRRPSAAAVLAAAPPAPPARMHTMHRQPSTKGTKAVKSEDSNHHPPGAPPTPAATASPASSSSSIPLPSFLSADPLSSDPDSSSSEDGFGQPKPRKPVRTSKSTGLPRPRPSYYYDADYDPGTAGNKKRGRRGGYKGVPVFEPTMEDFEGNGGFYGYVKRIEKYGLRSGIVKVIPPKEWSAQLPSVLPPLRDIRLREPIEQHMMGSQGLYRVTNVAKTRIWNAAQWRDLAVRDKWDGPDLGKEREKGERSERKVLTRREKKEERERERREREEEEADGESDAEDEDDEMDGDGDETPRKGRRTPAKKAGAASSSRGSSRSASKSKGASPSASASASVAADENGDTPMPPSSTTPSASTATNKKRLTNLERAIPSDSEWAAFAAKFEDLPHGMKREDYSPETMRDFERRYWRTLTFGEAPMYGADMAGSLFSDSTTAWNVAHLGDLLPKLAPSACSIPGVVSPYLYFGMWRATFAWHVEDADLYSINYIHFGAPKFWYSVPQEQAAKFERVMEGFFPTDFRKCHEFLRHKAFLASPRVLSNSGITLNRCAQLPGEFILTYPKGYHSGFNLGFNCAESINFATERWLPIGKVAKHCRCIDDSVNIDVNIWLREAAKAEALSKGEPWPYDDPPPAPAPSEPQKKRMAPPSSAPAPKKPKPAPSSSHGYNAHAHANAAPHNPHPSFHLAPEARAQLVALLQQHGGVLPPHLDYLNAYVPYLYAPPPPQPQNPYAKSSFVYGSAAAGASSSHSHSRPKPSSSGASTPAPPSASAAPTPPPSAAAAPKPPPPPKPAFVCALCPDLSTEGLVRVAEPGQQGQQQGKNGKGVRAHRVCVMFTPATWIEVDPATKSVANPDGEEIVRGYAKIEKARWKLKCQLCTEPHGTKIQCTKGKCTKAFHVTCALNNDDSGVLMDATVPDEEHEGAEVSILGVALGEQQDEKKKVEGGGEMAQVKDVVPNNDLIQLTVLCRTHNPDWQLREAERKAAELKAKVEALAPQARIKVRTTGGAFDVTLDSVDGEKETVGFVFDNGKPSSVKWKMILWPEDPEVARKKLEKQQRAEQAKAAVLDRPAYKNSAKRLSSANMAGGVPAPAPAPVAAKAPAPATAMGRQPSGSGTAAMQAASAAAYAQQHHQQQQQQQQAPRQNYYSAPPPPHYSHPSPGPYGYAPQPPQHQQQQYGAYPTHQQQQQQHGYYHAPPPQQAYYAAPPPPPPQHAYPSPHAPPHAHSPHAHSPVMQYAPSPQQQHQQQQAMPPFSSYASVVGHQPQSHLPPVPPQQQQPHGVPAPMAPHPHPHAHAHAQGGPPPAPAAAQQA